MIWKFLFALFFVVALSIPFSAYAASYISLTASDAGQDHAIRKVWPLGGTLHFGVVGDTEFTISINESSPWEIDTCWIYFDASYSVGTSKNVIVSNYREIYGIVVVKYNNLTYEAKEFHILPAWYDSENVTTGSSAPIPSSGSFPSDQTARGFMEAIASTAPDGPADIEEYCCCDEGGCFSMIATCGECSGSAPNCTGDTDC